MGECMYRDHEPYQLYSSKFYGLPEIHKTGTPSGQLYPAEAQPPVGAKVLAKVLKPLVGKSTYHIQSTRDFVSRVWEVTLLPGECLISYDVSALFTSEPIDPALNII